MLRLAVKMLLGDRARSAGLLFGIAFTSFLVTFAASFFCGFMTRGFALVSENSQVDVWVMGRAVSSVEQTTNMPNSALARVRSVEGVRWATPLDLDSGQLRFPNGRVQPVQVIGVDDATLAGFPAPAQGLGPRALRLPDAVALAEGGSEAKLGTPCLVRDDWPPDGPHLDVPLRMVAPGDELQLNDRRVLVTELAHALPRFPPRPLLYTTCSRAARLLPPRRDRLTFVLVTVTPGASPVQVAERITRETGLRARTSAQLEEDTVRWYLENSEDVGDVSAMLMLAITVGFGVTGVMLYMFTHESLQQYAVLKAMGATPGTLRLMILAQAGSCALLGTGVGLGACAVTGTIAATWFEFPFRMMWFTPLFGLLMVLLVGVVAALLSMRPVARLEPASVFAAG